MANLHRVRISWTGYPGSPGLSTFFFRAAAPPTLADAQTVADRCRAALLVLAPLIPNTVTMTVQSVVDTINDERGTLDSSFGVTPPAPVAGSNVAALGATFVAAGLELNTGTIVAGRRLRGRSFISPLPVAFAGLQAPNSSVLTTVQAYGVALVGASPPLALPLTVWSRPTATRLGSSAQCTSTSVAPGWFVLRSRRD